VYKFIGALVGFFILGRNFLGAMIGFVIGSVIDSVVISQSNAGQRRQSGDVFEYYTRQSARSHEDFATMLMALSAAVMRADGKPLKSELEYIKAFFTRQFGPNFTKEHLQVLKYFLSGNEVPLEKICEDIRSRTQLEVRIQLLHYLFGLAKADGYVADPEVKLLQRIATLMQVPHADYESIRSMFHRDANADYHVLGIEPTATDEEVKKAYRQMAVRYHPDKVAQMGEEFQKGAKEKFQQLQDAYDNIRKSRGMN
jgi:DnaJ like chaperone protein